MIIKATDSNFDGLISDGITLIKAGANWCGPCKAMEPIIEEISNEFPSVKIGKIDVDENSEVPTRLGIRNIPTILLYKNGTIVERKTGLLSKQQLKSMLDNQLSF